jgi:hypothetical protein
MTQFAMCTPTHMIFGGSKQYGSNAIRIEEDLYTCSSGHSDTYGNPPLVPEESSTNSFQLMDIEIFCPRR